jgi:hypothetical protein
VRSEKGYYLNSIRNAMIDYCRKEYRPNCADGSTTGKALRRGLNAIGMGRSGKPRVQYHGNRLGRRRTVHVLLNFEDVPPARLVIPRFHVVRMSVDFVRLY